MWSSVLTSDEELDLSELNSLATVNIGGWNFKVKYPSSLKSFTADQVLPPVFAEGSSLEKVYLISTKDYIKKLDSEQWKDFFKSLEKCKSIKTMELSRCECINDNCFYELNSENKKVEIFTGSKIDYCLLRASKDGMSYVLKHLGKVKKLFFGADFTINEWDNNLSFDNLTSLSINGKYFNDFSIFNNLSSLTSLTINNCENFKTLSGLEKLTFLTKLVVNNTGVSSVVPLKDLTNLTYLDLKNNAIGPNSDSEGKSVSNLDILASLHPEGSRTDNKKGNLKTLYLQGNNGLVGVIESHNILNLNWSGSIWK